MFGCVFLLYVLPDLGIVYTFCLVILLKTNSSTAETQVTK